VAGAQPDTEHFTQRNIPGQGLATAGLPGIIWNGDGTRSGGPEFG
jgi:hypothetical protein